MMLESRVKAAKQAEIEREEALEHAKTATKLALDQIPSVTTDINFATATETWKLTTTIETTKTKELTAQKESRVMIEMDF